jgi:GNAT superfamily N-acetyltransferase
MDIQVRAIDPHDDRALAAHHAVSVAATAHDVPDFPQPCPVWYAGLLRYPKRSSKRLAWVAYVDGQPAGALDLDMPMLDNTGNADVKIQVAPAYRRRGVGRTLYDHVVATVREHGRVRLIGEAVGTLPGGPARDGAGAAFAAAMGAKEALVQVRRRLDLSTVDVAAFAAVEAPGYSAVYWRERAPEEYVSDIGRLDGRLVTDAPMGDLVIEAPDIDAERVREEEESHIRRGERQYQVGIRHDASGALVAWTLLALEASVPDHAWQQITIVDPDHRGHRLGMWVKVANLRYLMAHEPAVRVIDTWNATSNTHMIAINEAVGFRAVDAWGMWQQEI